MVAYCAAHRIAVMGYSPLGSSADRFPAAHGTTLLNHATVNEIARAAGKTAGQVLIRFGLQRYPDSLVSIPKSSNADRIAQNFDVDFELSAEAMRQIAALESNFRYFISYLKKPTNDVRWHDGVVETGDERDWVGGKPAAAAAPTTSDSAEVKRRNIRTSRILAFTQLVHDISYNVSVQGNNQFWLLYFAGDFAAQARITTRIMSFWSFSGMFLKPLFAGVSDTYGRKSILMMPDTVDFVARIALIPLLSAAGKPSTAAVRVLVTGLLIGGTCGSCGVPMWNCALVRPPFSACPAP